MVFKLTHSMAVSFKGSCSQLFTTATHASSSQIKFKLRWWLPGKWHASLAKFVHFFVIALVLFFLPILLNYEWHVLCNAQRVTEYLSCLLLAKKFSIQWIFVGCRVLENSGKASHLVVEKNSDLGERWECAPSSCCGLVAQGLDRLVMNEYVLPFQRTYWWNLGSWAWF